MSYQWFVEPRGDVTHANEMIAKNLGVGADDTDRMNSGLRCKDGKTRKAWRCSFDEAHRLWDSRGSLGIEIEVWCRKDNGPAYIPKFLLSHHRRPTLRQLARAKVLSRVTA